MLYLFVQIWLWLLIAFIAGWLAHCFFCCRSKAQDQDLGLNDSLTAQNSNNVNNVNAIIDTPSTPEDTAAALVEDKWKPRGFSSRPNKVDDLKRIKGVGKVIETTLNELGIYQFSQIAQWSDDNIAWVENFTAFPGRIKRESWLEQSRTLAGGGTTEFAQRVDKGDVDY